MIRFGATTLLALSLFAAPSGYAHATDTTSAAVETVAAENGDAAYESENGKAGLAAYENVMPPTPLVIPFVLLLLMIATGPIFYHHFWETHYPKIAVALGAITAGYYLLFLNDPHNLTSLLHSVEEYVSFIALLGSLFVAAGGIMIKINRRGTPLVNAALLGIGAVIANFIGTTGASMLLIRPFIKINKGRVKPFHIVFFIFIVSNVGGGLTPIGDPPLFLGFLRGVPFFWTLTNLWYVWLPTILVLLAVFYLFDKNDLKKSEAAEPIEGTGGIEFKGLRNIAFLGIILVSVFLDPKVMEWVPSLKPMPFGIREIIMLIVMYAAFVGSDKEAMKANEFNWEPMKEVGFLFIGIFLTMTPALQIIGEIARQNSDKLNDTVLYWGAGILSGFLDNAPTYLNFLSAAMGSVNLDITIVEDVRAFVDLGVYLSAISVAAVFFGAATYIGNGPNFMVKSISEGAGVRMPSFFGYIVKYAIPILIPIYIIVWFVFYR